MVERSKGRKKVTNGLTIGEKKIKQRLERSFKQVANKICGVDRMNIIHAV